MEYCEPCNRSFVDPHALKQHLESKHPNTYCFRCKKHFSHSSAKQQHITDSSYHHICYNCPQKPDFDSESNLQNHYKTHAKKTVECLGCSRVFISDSAMVLHPEAGYCQSGADEDYVTECALECYQSGQYTSDDPAFDFQCPACGTPFSLMSALLQHAESVVTCDEHLERNMSLGKFLHYLRMCMRKL
ncbi:uncharacterized protein FPRO_16152 [Fusarium proliferatum ET1]|uniref:Related to zinc finger protein n=1 Tax=Fusarium proliferatum (strain ET1) TaxID=1227346 RepID=A0A1L7WBE7_FUSPR|nr:uncharacterized protein FPRO_16152 [Fusarium proliferatum ET1]CZR49948.1 related to zinc finger protein [Fusarium proliferatum ET1]